MTEKLEATNRRAMFALTPQQAALLQIALGVAMTSLIDDEETAVIFGPAFRERFLQAIQYCQEDRVRALGRAMVRFVRHNTDGLQDLEQFFQEGV